MKREKMESDEEEREVTVVNSPAAPDPPIRGSESHCSLFLFYTTPPLFPAEFLLARPAKAALRPGGLLHFPPFMPAMPPARGEVTLLAFEAASI